MDKETKLKSNQSHPPSVLANPTRLDMDEFLKWATSDGLAKGVKFTEKTIPAITIPCGWTEEDDERYYLLHFGHEAKAPNEACIDHILFGFEHFHSVLDAATCSLVPDPGEIRDELLASLSIESKLMLLKTLCSASAIPPSLQVWLAEEISASEATLKIVTPILLRFTFATSHVWWKELVECAMWIISAGSDINELLMCNSDRYLPPPGFGKGTPHAGLPDDQRVR